MEITLDRDLRSYIQKYLDHQTNNIDDSLFQKTIIENHKKITDPDLVGLIFSFLEENCFDSGELFHLFYLKKIEIEEPVSIPQRFQKDLSLEETKKVIEEVKRNLKDYWKCFRI